MLDPFDFSNCPSFHSDIHTASEAITRAKAINAKHDAERLRMIDALNKAIVVIGTLAVFGIAVVAGAEQSRRIALDQQENIAWKR